MGEPGERVLVAQGREAEVFALADGNVMKLWRHAAYEPRLRRETAALAALHDSDRGYPAPRVIDSVTVHGRPGLVMERIDGTDLLSQLGRRPLTVFRAGTVMGDVHAAMHECAAPSELPDLHDELRLRIVDAAALPDDLRARALDVLDTLPNGDRLCHGDLHLGNILGSWSAPMVIDWGDASRGDPVADVARTWLLHRFGEPPPGAPRTIRVLAPVGRRILVERYLRAYRRRRPVDQHRLERWEIVRAAARLGEPIPEERPALLRLLGERLGTAADATS
jgi:aminoglycoside phosphotransferase (APT) family kinase protein